MKCYDMGSMTINSAQPNGIVIHYHEIALKGANRPMFLKRLVDNIRQGTPHLGVEDILAPRGRIIVRLKEDSDWLEILNRIRNIFGIANFSPVWRCPLDFSQLEQAILSLLEGRSFESFRISARRADKRYPMTSMELDRKLGKSVQDKKKARVDLSNPEFTIHVEITPKEALVYFDKYQGPGGLPVGTSGRVACLLSGGFDSPVASYHMMKRGCNITFIHFHSHPFLSRASLEKAEELVEKLNPHQFDSRLYAVSFGEIQRRIVLAVPSPLRVVLYRRFMLRIADEIAYRENAKALITGESLGQVASQTLENLVVIQEASRLSILRPLIGLDKQEIIQMARKIGTYEISAQPDQDCCRLFVPPHPSVRARLEDVRRAEAKLAVDDLVKLGLDSLEVRDFHFPA